MGEVYSHWKKLQFDDDVMLKDGKTGHKDEDEAVLKKSPHTSLKMMNGQVKYCLRPSQDIKVRLRLHHRGRFVTEPVKLYVGGVVTEMDWRWDVDFMSYMDLEALIKSHDYVDINSLWYRNPVLSFTRGLKPLNNDNDVLQFTQDVVGHEVIDVYVDHKVSSPPEIVDPSEVYVDDDVEIIGGNDFNEKEKECEAEQVHPEGNEKDCEAEQVHPEGNEKNVMMSSVKTVIFVRKVKTVRRWIGHRDAVKECGMDNQKNVFIKKNDAKRIVVRCMGGCKYYLRFSKRSGQQYWQPSGLVAVALEKWEVKISCDQAYKAKRRAMDLLQGAGLDQFNHLRSYAEELLKSNPNSTVVIKPLVGLDACFLKGETGGQLMSAVGRDANNQIYPIAYAVVEAETKDSWEWFLHLLIEDLGALNQKAYGFISDQQKGLVPAIQGLSEHVEQRLCVKHLYGNWKKKHSGLELKEVMWATARATTVPQLERSMEKMKLLDEGAWKDMMNTLAKFWTRAHFRTDTKCDMQVNNMCEAFNIAVLEHRDKPIITLLEGIKHYITKRITKQKELLQNYEGAICPRIQMLIEKNKKQAQGWSPTWHGDNDLSIFGVNNGVETYCVNLKKETCSCRKWDLTGIPCCHVISCIWNIKKQPENYVSDFYSKSTFEKIYANIVLPTNGPQLWPIVDHVPICPPVMRRAIWRPKKMRNKATDE
ncbi:uncharacterized protein LOC131633127 [Vicia villosa]|uniref:uncharacterized protein LOC131633127 n=1 Tax=Vicia villosa TaxID=3911 RepID=UPI00273A778F|nr:uncharacterized protein LOC131633127 [Vicia villosa]